MTDDDARQLVSDYWDAFASKDVSKAMTFFSDDAVYEDKAIEHIATGKTDISALWNSYFDAASEGFKPELTSSLVTSAGYAWSWTVKGKIDGAFGGLEGSGQEFSMDGASIGQLRDGKIVRQTDYWNLANVMRQVQSGDEAPAK